MPSGHSPSGGPGGYGGGDTGGFSAESIRKGLGYALGFATNPTGTLLGFGLDAISTGLANQASAQQAQISRDFQAGQSGTAHQREVADLRAAGLNPILSGTGGRGASTPGGAMATQIPVTSTSSALQSFKVNQEVLNMQQLLERTLVEIQRTRSQYHLATEQAITEVRNQFLRDMQGQLTDKSITEKSLQIEIVREQLKMWQREGEITGSEAGLYLRWLTEIGGAFSGIKKSLPGGR